MGSQETFLSNYEGNSQDLRNRGPHKRRLTTSRGKLTNIHQEPDKELVSPKSVSAVNLYHSSPPPVTPSSSSSTNASPNRKISYVHAVNNNSSSSGLESLQSVNEESTGMVSTTNDRTEFPFTNYTHRPVKHDRKISAGGGMYTTAASQRTSKGSMNYSDVHHRRWSSIEQAQPDRSSSIEIFGPTSSSNTEWLHRNRRFEQQQEALLKGPESQL